MEKTNLSKRVVAGTLALLTVFGSAPASLQGVFAPTALTVNAANLNSTLAFGANTKSYITSIKIGDNTIPAETLAAFGDSLTAEQGKTVVVKSKAPLTIADQYGASSHILRPGKKADKANFPWSTGTLTNEHWEAEDGPVKQKEALTAERAKFTQATLYQRNGNADFKYEETVSNEDLDKFETGTYKSMLYLKSTADSDYAYKFNEYMLEEGSESAAYYVNNDNDGKESLLQEFQKYLLGELDTLDGQDSEKLNKIHLSVDRTKIEIDAGLTYEKDGNTVEVNAGSFAFESANVLDHSKIGDVDITLPEYSKLDQAPMNRKEIKAKYSQTATTLYVLKAGASDDTDVVPNVTNNFTDGYEGATVTSYTTDEKYGESTTLLEKLDAEIAKYEQTTDIAVTKTGSNGDYTYTFTLPVLDYTSTITMTAATADSTIKEEKVNGVDALAGAASFKVNGTDVTLTNAARNLAPIVVDSDVVITSAKPFEITINDNNDNNNLTKPNVTYDSAANPQVFKATFKMPASATSAPVEMIVKPVAETYTYTANGDKLLATSSTGSVKDVEAATIGAYWNDATKAADAKKTVIANNGKVATGTVVYLDATAAEKLGTFSDIKVYKDGSTTPLATYQTIDAATKASFDKTGIYEAVLTYVGKDTKPYTISTKFEIVAPAKLTADNVTLTIATSDGQNIFENTTVKGTKDGVAAFTIARGKTLDDRTFTVTPVLKDGETVVDISKVSGYVSGATVGKDYSMEIEVSDEVRGTYTFEVKWTVKLAAATYDWNDVADFGVSLEDIDGLSDTIYNKVTGQNKAPKEDIRYEYVEGKNGAAISEDELDERESGLPTKEGEYTIYVIYNDEAVKRFNLTVGDVTALTLGYDESALSVTYGDKLDFSKYTLTETNSGKKSDVKIVAQIADIKKAVLEGTAPKMADGKYVTGDRATYTTTDKGTFLDAGTYIVEFQAADGSVPKGYSVSKSNQYVLTVAKKQITADMVTFEHVSYVDAVDPRYGDENGYDIVTYGKPSFYDIATGDKDSSDDQLVAAKGSTSKYVKVKEGPKQNKIGTYQATVTAIDKNYTGTAEVDWHIICEAYNGNFAGLKFDETKTTIYDNGRIHFEVNRNADDKIVVNENTYANATSGTKVAAGTKLGVKEYGIILDKTGKFDAMTNSSAEALELAAKELVYGNGYDTGSYKAGDSRGKEYDASNQVFKVNISALDTTTYFYARPFVILEDGRAVYGAPLRINLTEAATTAFGLTCADGDYYQKAFREASLDRTAATYQGDLAKVKNGYDVARNKFYAYASFNDLDKIQNGKEFKVENFGIIIDKTGKLNDKIANEIKDQKITNEAEYKKFVSNELAFDGEYQVGKYDPNNKVLKTNQATFTITPKDSVTGFWVRAYLDLGNDLIVYTEPHYYASASEYYAEKISAASPKFNTHAQKVDGSTTKYQVKVATVTTPTTSQLGLSQTDTVVFKQRGVVLDKDEVYINNPAKLVSGDGVKTGVSTKNDGTYTGKFTPNATKETLVRPYVIYTVNGKDVTIYGMEIDHIGKNYAASDAIDNTSTKVDAPVNP